MKKIDSVNNFRVLQWAALQDKRKRDNARAFIAEGYHIVREASRSGYLQEVITTENREFPGVPT
jgi:TrmH family RNA methyltransferase